MKRILDTVHGYIMVEDHFIRNIVDTKCFQRLRRIEQTSIRAVYPSARHDRFIHSLGVYHIGSLIVDHLKREAKTYNYWSETEATMGIIYDSYLAACLLHDVGHAPFSHSFEKYYGQKSLLSGRLKEIINKDAFSSDIDAVMDYDAPNFHEFMSAIVTCTQFKTGLNRMNIDPEFVARMITGTLYENEKDTHQIHNCFITLLHGHIIDADRLDYACRDVWASGYSTSSIDLRRLISALHILQNSEKQYVVCFESNSLNEIMGVLNVKDFQVRYVINHHTVSYEQWLLDKAVCTMAKQFFPDLEETSALSKIICEEAVTGSLQLPQKGLTITNLSDDDLIFLMKQGSNKYYEEWCSRKYNYFPLWKSRDEFNTSFKGIEKNADVSFAKFESLVRPILESIGLDYEQVIITQANFKPRVNIDNLYMVVSGEVIKYKDIYPSTADINKNEYFYYVYIRKEMNETIAERQKRKKFYLLRLHDVMMMLYYNEKG